MLPVIALVGRPNVGKSTLFNRLTNTRDALVADFPGLTRDRKYGQAKVEGLAFIVVDTGGISGDEEGIDAAMAEQSLLAIEEADVVLDFTVPSIDARPALHVDAATVVVKATIPGNVHGALQLGGCARVEVEIGGELRGFDGPALDLFDCDAGAIPVPSTNNMRWLMTKVCCSCS